MLKKRVLSSIVGIALCIAAAYFDEPVPWFAFFIAAWGGLAVWEFCRITGVSSSRPLTAFTIICTVLFIMLPQYVGVAGLPAMAAAAVIVPMLILILGGNQVDAFRHWAWAVAGIFYVGLLMSLLVALRAEAGRDWIYLAVLTTFALDTSAYFTGRFWGRRRLAPKISPGKTWEGAVGGFCAAIAISLLLVWLLKMPLTWGQAALLGGLIGFFGQLGDLGESMLKRHAGVKESGFLVPGHGGLLDRMDSIVMAGVTAYMFWKMYAAGWLGWL
ncbi:phosphatidate cytidylyltransferase [Chloroflexota bacterium]